MGKDSARRWRQRHGVSKAGLLFLLMAVGCSSPPPPPEALFPVPGPRSVRKTSDRLAARLYFDATSSMSGFTAVPSNAGYVSFAQRLDQAFAIGWKNSSIDCYKFGLRVNRLGGSKCWLSPTEPGFYDLTEKDDVTRIDVVLEQIDPSALTVILTDLYQDDADLGAIFQAVKRSVFSRNLSIGIAGILSPFAGRIYDIGLHREMREWTKERPLYALVIGQKGDVIKCFEELTKLSVPRERMLILSADLLERPLDWSAAVGLEPDHVAEDDRVMAGTTKLVRSKGIRLQSSDEPCRLRIRIRPDFSPFHPPVGLSLADALVPSLEVRLLRKGAGSPVSGDGLSARYYPAPQSNDPRQGGNAALELVWRPRSFQRSASYLLELRVAFNPKAAVFPTFVSAWSVPVAGALVGDRFDGSKTQNLQEFVNGLWRILLQQYGESLGAFYIYFQK